MFSFPHVCIAEILSKTMSFAKGEGGYLRFYWTNFLTNKGAKTFHTHNNQDGAFNPFIIAEQRG